MYGCKGVREAIDALYEGRFQDADQWMEEVGKVSNRDFTTGFSMESLDLKPIITTQFCIRRYDFIGLVTGYDKEAGRLIVEQRNHFRSVIP